MVYGKYKVAEKGTGSCYSSLLTSEFSSSTMVFSSLASSMSELVLGKGRGGRFIRPGAFVREGHTCQLRGPL